MKTLIIDGVTVSAPSGPRCLEAFHAVMGYHGTTVLNPAPTEPQKTKPLPVGFAISPTSGQMVAVA